PPVPVRRSARFHIQAEQTRKDRRGLLKTPPILCFSRFLVFQTVFQTRTPPFATAIRYLEASAGSASSPPPKNMPGSSNVAPRGLAAEPLLRRSSGTSTIGATRSRRGTLEAPGD